MVVERARGESQSMSGSLQSLCWGSSAFGGIVSSYFSGSFVDSYGVRYFIYILSKSAFLKSFSCERRRTKVLTEPILFSGLCLALLHFFLL